jgi:hypothetical protein
MLYCRIIGLSPTTKPGRVFGLHLDQPGIGTTAILFMNQLCLDPASSSLVVDMAVVPLEDRLMHILGPAIVDILNSCELVNIPTTFSEAIAWKKLLPAFVERCRTWSHGQNCEYAATGCIPLSTELDESPLCSCGRNIGLPSSIPGVPAKAWAVFRPFATRAAFSPLFAVSYVEPVAAAMKQLHGLSDRASAGSSSRQEHPPTSSQVCKRCYGPGKPKLLQCSKCRRVKYCSRECSVKDWKEHKVVCERI